VSKGGDFEREVAKFLTFWLTGKEKPYVFWRMPGSGSLSTIHEENKNLSGDITALSSEAEFLTDLFSIECKTGYPKTSFWQHFKNIKNFNVETFWRQCVEDANKAGKFPMLIYRKKGNKPIVGITEFVVSRIKLSNSKLPYLTIHFPEKNLPNLCFFNFSDFWNEITPEKIKGLI